MASLVKMNIGAFSDGTFSNKVSSYTVMLNPDSIKLDRNIEYNEQQPPDSGHSSLKYKHTPGEQLSFELVLDCTGVVDSKRTDLPDELSQLQAVVYDYNGSIHRPNFVKIQWGIGSPFKGVLTSYNTAYNLFDPDGIPLRAKVSLQFTSYTDPATAAKEDGKESPDMTHLISVVAGDTLPLLSQKTYETPDYYVQLAEFNGLNKFRQLQPGTQLVFPPIVGAND